jgi:hypothetical protein
MATLLSSTLMYDDAVQLTCQDNKTSLQLIGKTTFLTYSSLQYDP